MTDLKIRVEYVGHVRSIADNKKEEEIEMIDSATVSDLLLLLSKRYGDPFEKAIYEPGSPDIKVNFIATVNGYLLNQLKGVKTELKNKDRVALLPIVSGG